MKRPAFTPRDIGVTNPDATGAVILHLKDAKGHEQMVPVTAALRAALGQRLLSGMVLAQEKRTPALYLAPTKTRVYRREDGDLAVELQLEGGRAIHMLLRGLLADALVQQIQEIQTPASGSAH